MLRNLHKKILLLVQRKLIKRITFPRLVCLHYYLVEFLKLMINLDDYKVSSTNILTVFLVGCESMETHGGLQSSRNYSTRCSFVKLCFNVDDLINCRMISYSIVHFGAFCWHAMLHFFGCRRVARATKGNDID